jgi:hypothetical protein
MLFRLRPIMLHCNITWRGRLYQPALILTHEDHCKLVFAVKTARQSRLPFLKSPP